MYEQDVKLARMLVEKIKALRSEEDSVKHDLDQARQELSRVEQIREERDAYLAILSEAADLLDSKDLVVDNPDTTEQKEQVDNLEFKLEELDEESQKYSRLIDALREKAPQLFESVNEDDPDAAPELSEEAREASSEETVASAEVADAVAEPVEEEAEEEAEEELAEAGELPAEETAPEEEPAIELNAADEQAEDQQEEEDEESGVDEQPEPETLEVHVSSNGHAGDAEHVNGNGAHEAVAIDEDDPADMPAPSAEAEDQPAPGEATQVEATVVKVAVESPERTLSRFNLDHLKKKEAFTFGRGAAYIVDGDSVLDRLPYYDFSLRGVLEAQTRDELARDIDVLSTELHGKFHIVYSSQYNPSIQLGEHVSLSCANGDGGKDAADEHIRELVSELIAKHTCVCVITGDVALADSVRGQSIHILQLHDFFRA
ncbi:hypothetical protein KDL29_08300 [bacterium]|nr:hypothetical protein [bacterium]